MSMHPLRWQSPQPLWTRLPSAVGGDAVPAAQAQPAILRFSTDDFMEQLFGTLERDPARIDALIARHETWRAPMSEAPDLIARTPAPRLASSAARATAAAAAPVAIAAPSADERPLKLYQPAHQRHYLVAASLVCGVHGLPERALTPGGVEEVFAVVRRLLPAANAAPGDATLHEFAYVKDAAGARWQRCGASDGDSVRLVPGEDRLPLFPLSFRDDDARPRALWAGMIPVGRREEYLGSRVDHAVAEGFAVGQRRQFEPTVMPQPPLSKMARMAQFQSDVAEPWKVLVRSAFKFVVSPGASPDIGGESEPAGAEQARIREFNLQQQAASWLVLLDCADLIATHLSDVWAAIDGNGAGYAALSQARKDLYDWLGTATMGATLPAALIDPKPRSASLRAALKAIRAPGVREKLEASTATYAGGASSTLNLADWPPFMFCLAGVDLAMLPTGPFAALDNVPGANAEPSLDPVAANVPGQDTAMKVDRFTALYTRALEATRETEAPPIPFALQVKNALGTQLGTDINDGGWFVVRFVHLRRDCGPLHPPTVSVPTRRFKLAGFFDADAPARPIRISLPSDTSPAGLRKFNRNTAFVMSDMLCGQVQRAKGLGFVDLVRSVLPWPLHKALDVGSGGPCKSGNGVDIGMICSISIPIITICALILLIIIVSLLDFVFRWLPYFILCFPVPGMKGKQGSS